MKFHFEISSQFNHEISWNFIEISLPFERRMKFHPAPPLNVFHNTLDLTTWSSVDHQICLFMCYLDVFWDFFARKSQKLPVSLPGYRLRWVVPLPAYHGNHTIKFQIIYNKILLAIHRTLQWNFIAIAMKFHCNLWNFIACLSLDEISFP